MKPLLIVLMCLLLCSCTSESSISPSAQHDQSSADVEHHTTEIKQLQREPEVPFKQIDDRVDNGAAGPPDPTDKPSVTGTVRLDEVEVQSGLVEFQVESQLGEGAEAVINDGTFSIPAGRLNPGQYKIKLTLDPPTNNPPPEDQ